MHLLVISLVEYIKINDPLPSRSTKVIANRSCKIFSLNKKQNQILPTNIDKIKFLFFKKIIQGSLKLRIAIGKCKTNTIQPHLGTFRHNQIYPGIIQAYLGIFRTMCNPGIFGIAVYPEPGHIQNQKHIQKPGIHNPSIFRTPVYSKCQHI